jgi:hypothetical protein
MLSAALKCHELATGSLKGREIWDTRWFWSGLVEVELAAALWLFSELHARVIRLLLVLMFLGFFEVSLYQGFKGAPSCGCFGKVSVPPWWMVPLDGLTLVALVLWRPPQDALSADQKSLSLILSLWLVLGVPAWFAAHHYSPGGVHRDLRRDRRLSTQVALTSKNPPQKEILESLRNATGLNVTIADELAVRPPNYGEVQLLAVPACSVMEWIAQKEKRGAEWHKIKDGYELRPVAWWKRVNAVAISVVFMLAFLTSWRIATAIRSRRTTGESSEKKKGATHV